MKHHAEAYEAMTLPEVKPAAPARFLRYLTDRFLLLPLGALVAVVWANTAPDSYFRFAHPLTFPINEVAMALFLALVAQEVREALMPRGALHTWRRWGLPLIAAGGGIVGATATYLVYVGLKYEAVLVEAWPIACAIDVAAAYYVLKLVWHRSAALPFVLLLALATDAVGVLVLALRPQAVALQPGGVLLMLGALGVAAGMRSARVKGFAPYILICGPLSWFALYMEGVYPALALLPIVPFLPRSPRPLELFADPPDDTDVHHFEHQWNEVVQVILFLFGLVNAGVLLRSYDTGTWAILAAALVGRPLGIGLAVAAAVAAGFRLPARVGWRGVIVIALATSSGFTFALIFATGLIPVGPVLAAFKLGALSTVVAAVLALAAARLLRVGKFAR